MSKDGHGTNVTVSTYDSVSVPGCAVQVVSVTEVSVWMESPQDAGNNTGPVWRLWQPDSYLWQLPCPQLIRPQGLPIYGNPMCNWLRSVYAVVGLKRTKSIGLLGGVSLVYK